MTREPSPCHILGKGEMILNGMLPIHMRHNGQMLIKVIIVVLIAVLLLSGCSRDWIAGDGRGDWTVELCAGYSIVKINSRQICLGYKESLDAPGSSIIISNYFVTAYGMSDSYIFLKGIQTKEHTISNDERHNPEFVYYLVNTTDDDVIGPFEAYDDFLKLCSSLGLEIETEWNRT